MCNCSSLSAHLILESIHLTFSFLFWLLQLLTRVIQCQSVLIKTISCRIGSGKTDSLGLHSTWFFIQILRRNNLLTGKLYHNHLSPHCKIYKESQNCLLFFFKGLSEQQIGALYKHQRLINQRPRGTLVEWDRKLTLNLFFRDNFS